MLEKCETLSNEGLRTLVIAQKVLTQDEYNKWHDEYKRAKNDYERGDILAEQV
jgi:phospholipid-translocating ATPase